MKVLLVNSYFKPYILGGAEISTELLAKALCKKGVEVVLLSVNPECYGIKKEVVDEITIYRINPFNPYLLLDKTTSSVLRPLKALMSAYNIFAYFWTKRIIDIEKPTVVHTNNLYDLSPLIWKAAKSLKVPVIHTVRDYDLLCMKDNAFINFFCKEFKKRKFSAIQYVDVFTFISDFIRAKHENLTSIRHSEKVTIYNAIEIDAAQIEKIVKDRMSRKRDKVRFLYLGRADESKGIYLLLEAFNEIIREGYQNIVLSIMADVRDDVVRKYSRCQQIFFHGFLKDKEKEEVLLDSDVAIVPSIWDEPFGRVIIESYAYALPVIGSSAGAIPELLHNEQEGLIFNAGDKEHLKTKIKIFADEPFLVKKYLVNAAKKSELFDIKHQYHHFLKIYNKLTSNVK